MELIRLHDLEAGMLIPRTAALDLHKSPTIIKRRCTMKNVLTVMMVICLTLPANAVVTKSAQLSTHKPQPAVKIVNNATKDKSKDLMNGVVRPALLFFFMSFLGNLAAYKILQSSEEE
jgi:hypothetical protein